MALNEPASRWPGPDALGDCCSFPRRLAGLSFGNQGKSAVVRTAIGRRLSSSRSRLAVVSAVGILVVSADVALVWWGRCTQTIEAHIQTTEGRGVLAVVALAAHFRLTDG